MLPKRNHFNYKETSELKVLIKGWKKIFHANTSHKKARVAILKSDKVYSRTKRIPLVIKRTTSNDKIHNNIMSSSGEHHNLNVYVPNN